MKPKATALMLYLVLIPFLAQAEVPDPITGKVTAVIDADIIRVLDDRGREYRVYLYGIDCPELDQLFGGKARRYTSDLVLGKNVTVLVWGAERHDRVIGKVFHSYGSSLNRTLVMTGLAWWNDREAPEDGVLKQLEANARALRLGLWNDPRPVPPWEFREGGRSEAEESKGESNFDGALEPIVYITHGGRNYHRLGCSIVSRSGIPLFRSEAEWYGYQPCGACGADEEPEADLRPESIQYHLGVVSGVHHQKKNAEYTRWRAQNRRYIDERDPARHLEGRPHTQAARFDRDESYFRSRLQLDRLKIEYD